MAAKRKEEVKLIKVAIADDHLLFCKGMAALINDFDGMKLIIEAVNGLELLDKMKQELPDVVLMDLEMPEMDGMEATSEIMRKYPDVKVIALTQYTEEKFISHMMKLGASGYLLKTTGPEELEDAIWAVMETGSYHSGKVFNAMHKGLKEGHAKKPTFDPSDIFTGREYTIMQMVCKGLSSKKIADRLSTTVSTVEKQRQNVLEKANCANTPELVVWAIKNGLME